MMKVCCVFKQLKKKNSSKCLLKKLLRTCIQKNMKEVLNDIYLKHNTKVENEFNCDCSITIGVRWLCFCVRDLRFETHWGLKQGHHGK